MEQSWTTRQHPEGFALDVPAGWESGAEAGRIDATGTDGERVTILPLRSEAQLDARRARDILLTYARQFWPRQRWEMPPGGWQFDVNGVRAVGAETGALRQIAGLWWANTAEGATAFFYALAAPPPRFKSLEFVFARILGSFRVTHAGQTLSSHPLAGMQFQRWTDPSELAFTIEAPAGWHVSGGIMRPGIAARYEYVLQSPDGQVSVRCGDVNFVARFMEPNITMQKNGVWEGQFTSDGRLIMRYKSGMDFAAYYVQMTTGRSCQNLQWLDGADRRDYTHALAWYAHALRYSHHTAGEVTYSCLSGGRPYVGYQFAETAVTHHSDLATMWNLQALFGFIATPQRARLADAVLQHTLATLSFSPQWMQRETQSNQLIAENFRRYREQTAQLLRQTQEARWASWDRIVEQRGDLLSNQTRVVDPQTGEAYKVQSGSNYYWIDPARGVIHGTDIPYLPTTDFHAMMMTYD